MANVSMKTGGKGNMRGNFKTGVNVGDEGFWNRPALINLLADLLFLLAGALLAWEGMLLMQRLPVAPLKQLNVVVSINKVSPAQIEHTARTAIAGNFFTVDLEQAQAAFQRLPWVRRASLRRTWPDSIELVLEEQQPVARWTSQDGESRLVNGYGEVFGAATAELLPIFSGPEGSAPRVLVRYREFAETLTAIERTPIAIRLSPREAWQLKLDDGVVLELGRDQPKIRLSERLARFTAHYAAVKNRLHAIHVVDMRYFNGFALSASAS